MRRRAGTLSQVANPPRSGGQTVGSPDHRVPLHPNAQRPPTCCVPSFLTRNVAYFSRCLSFRTLRSRLDAKNNFGEAFRPCLREGDPVRYSQHALRTLRARYCQIYYFLRPFFLRWSIFDTLRSKIATKNNIHEKYGNGLPERDHDRFPGHELRPLRQRHPRNVRFTYAGNPCAKITESPKFIT